MSRTSKDILSLQKLYYFFDVLFLLRILLRTLDMVVLEDSLADLKLTLGLMEYFVFVWFCIFYLPNIL